MSVEIIPITDHEQYEVNGHMVYKDHLNNWSCKQDLSNKELQAFKKYEEVVIKNPRIKKHFKSIYKS